jgi:hypothetical protein
MANAQGNHQLHTRQIGAGHLNWIDGSVFHRINLIDNAESWTLFIHSSKAKNWGFLQTQGRQHSFHDHDSILDQGSSPLWWKTAPRPVDYPSMRQPVTTVGATCIPTISR